MPIQILAAGEQDVRVQLAGLGHRRGICELRARGQERRRRQVIRGMLLQPGLHFASAPW